jgi:hypothetical protein
MNQEPTITCPRCGNMRPAGIAACSICAQTPGTRCRNCGTINPLEYKVCYNCGQRLAGTNRVLWLVLFLVVGIPGCCLGSCFLSMANPSQDAVTLFFGIAGVAVFLFLLVMLIRNEKK